MKQAEINFVAGPESTITVNLIKNQLIDMQQKDKYNSLLRYFFINRVDNYL